MYAAALHESNDRWSYSAELPYQRSEQGTKPCQDRQLRAWSRVEALGAERSRFHGLSLGCLDAADAPSRGLKIGHVRAPLRIRRRDVAT